MPAGFKHAFEKAQGVDCIPVLSEPTSDEGIIMRPYGPVMIRHWVVTRLARADGTDTPSREEVFIHQALRHTAGAVGTSDLGKQAMPGIRDGDATLALFSIQGESIGSHFFDPEGFLKVMLEGTRLL